MITQFKPNFICGTLLQRLPLANSQHPFLLYKHIQNSINSVQIYAREEQNQRV